MLKIKAQVIAGYFDKIYFSLNIIEESINLHIKVRHERIYKCMLDIKCAHTAIITESVKMYNYIANIGRYLPESKCLII